jgi:hypothetical protein
VVDEPAFWLYAESAAAESFRAGHALAGVLLILSLVALRYVDEARLSEGWKRYVRSSIPSAAIFLPLVPKRDRAERIHLSGLCGSGRVGDRSACPGSGAVEEK